MKALCFDRFGGPEVLYLREVADPVGKPGHAVVRLSAIGLNFADVYRRKGNYHLTGAPPYINGYEGAGVIESLGDSDSDFEVGDAVGFADSPYANAERVLVPLEKLIPLPPAVDAETAAALLLQGLSAQYLAADSHRILPGETVAVHAAAGGVGLLLIQIAKLQGARVLGLTSSESKRAAALEAGADQVVLYDENWPEAAKRFAGGGVDVIYDSVGSTLLSSFEAVRTGGHVVFFGMAGGDPPAIDPRMLMDTSKSLTGGDLWNVLRSHAERVRRANELFTWVREGRLRVRIAARYPLAKGAEAHAFLESRGSIGKVLLIP
ncbi:quinone oxidoreductase [Pendulispora brunnea]|uniref:Quinone oxidoreductase n=1 Tax=Pendulispora brunnea TaxID=2905690 RepID=A0ABZ2K4C2_9BACT